MKAWHFIIVACVAYGSLVYWCIGPGDSGLELLNVSYDPTRELWRDLNQRFLEEYAAKHNGVEITIKQSHDGSSTQSGKVLHGLEADVVTLCCGPTLTFCAKTGSSKKDGRNGCQTTR